MSTLHLARMLKLPDDYFSDPIRRNDLQQALNALPARQRTIVCSRFVDGLTIADLARQLGLSRSTIYTALGQGLYHLQRHLHPAVFEGARKILYPTEENHKTTG